MVNGGYTFLLMTSEVQKSRSSDHQTNVVVSRFLYSIYNSVAYELVRYSLLEL